MQHIFNKLTQKPLRWLVEQTVSYWHKTPYAFRLTSSGYTLEPGKRSGLFTIVARCHYQEYVKTYPIAQLKELKQILKTEYQQPYVLHYIAPEQNQQRAVCTLVIDPQVIRQIGRSTLIIPETLLMWQALPKGEIAYQSQSSEPYFLLSSARVPTSQLINRFCADFTSFSLNNGVNDAVKLIQLPAAQYANQLATAFNRSLPHLPKLSLLAKTQLLKMALPVKAMAITALSVLVSYGAAVTLYYHIAITDRQNKITALGIEVNELLQLQQQLQQTTESAAQLQILRLDKHATAHIWQVVITLIQQQAGVSIQNVTLERGRFMLRGEAEQATAVLSALQASSFVIDASFDAPVRRQRDRDAFVIAVTLAQQPLTATTGQESVNAAE